MPRKLAVAATALFLAFAGVVASLATISSALNKTIVGGNGSQTAFTFPFVGVAAGDISVTYTTAAGISTLLTNGPGPTQYQLVLNAAVAPALWGIGGTVTYNPSGTPIATGTTLTILRTLPYTQLTSLQNQASFGQLAQATEQALDQLEMQIQQIAQSISRVLQAPATDSSSAACLTLPAAAQRANTGLLFDTNGCPIAGTTPATGTISSAMQPVVGAASLAAGRTALGLGSMALENINGGTCGGASLQDDGSGNARVVLGTVADAVGQSVTCAFHLQQRIATGPITYTLPRANTLFNGFGFWIVGVAGTITIAVNASDAVQIGTNSLASGTSLQIAAGTAAFVATNAASSGIWYVRLYVGGGAIGVALPGVQPTRTTICQAASCSTNSASGTYTTPLGATRLVVRECAGGGGGGGTGTSGASNGGNGGDTTFNAVTAAHGVGGALNNGTGSNVGAIGGTGGAGTATLRVPGQAGGGAASLANYANNMQILNSPGGNAPFGLGFGATIGNAGLAPAASGFCSGGGGSGTGAPQTLAIAAGGGAGEGAEFQITAPAATYTFAAGAGGTAGGAGASGTAGSAGRLGIIIIDESYNFLLKRDLAPAANDNTPMWLDLAA